MLPGGRVWVGRPNRWSGSGLAALPEVWKALPKVQEGLRDPHGGLGRVVIYSRKSRGFGRPSRRSSRGKEALLEVR